MGRIIFEGPQAFVDLGKRARDLCDDRWPNLLKSDIGLAFVDQIPGAPEWAVGLWRGGTREGFVRTLRRRDGTPRAMTIMYLTLHEGLGHPSDQDRMSGRRGTARRLMHPFPDSWRDVDQYTGMTGYWHLPFECYANRLVEGLTQGAVRSPYDDDYTRWIPDGDLDKLIAIPLDDFVAFAAVDPDSADDTVPDEIVEPPPDPRLLEALERLQQSRQLFKRGVELTEGWQELRP
jgi:hypothetical protein